MIFHKMKYGLFVFKNNKLEIKMKTKQFIYFFLFLMLANISLLAQSHTMTKTPQIEKSVEQDSWNNGTIYSYDYDNNNDYKISSWTEPNDTTHYYETRTGYKFDLSDVPSNAINLTAYLEAYRISGSKNSKIVLMSNNVNFGSKSDVFNKVGSGSYLFTTNTSSGILHDITSQVNSRLSQGYINIGVMEYDYGFHEGNIAIKLHIDFQVSITVKNNFSGGTVKVNGITRTSPYSFAANVGSTVNIEAIEQNNGGYYWLWNDSEAPNNKSKWLRWKGTTYEVKSANKSYSFTVTIDDNGAEYEAGLRKLCNVTFKNEHSGGESGGTIKVNGTTYNSPTSNFNVVEQNEITATAIDHTIDEIRFTFEKWSDNSTQKYNHVFTPSSHTQYKAIFTGKPRFGQDVRNLHFNSYNPRVQQYVKLYWNEHPSSKVTKYRIWRSGKDVNGNNLPTELLATVNRGTTSYTDYDYYLTGSYTDTQLQYDVQAYYSPDNTYTDHEFITVYGEGSGVEKPSGNDSTNVTEIVYDYNIDNYPNPFNPTTTINYTVKETGNVNITVFDALGRKVKELVNEIKQPGAYNITFDATNLSNGVYYYTMKVNDFIKTNKMLLTK